VSETDSAVELIVRLEQDARRIAQVFGLRYRTIEPERPHVRRRLGVCYADGTIRIRLFHARSGRPLKYSSLVDTLCHELAHLRHFNHGRRFQALYRRILEHARRAGIYQPGPGEREWGAPAPLALPQHGAPRAPRAARSARALPEQLALF
jgi:predicted metal-dependent hydrolase